MANLRRAVALGNTPLTRAARRAYRAARQFHVPMPRVVGRPYYALFAATREAVYGFRRLFVAEPLFRGACHSYGRNLRTGIFVHFVSGQGELVFGDDVHVDGKSSFSFAARYAERPRLTVGSRTFIGHACTFTVARGITLGDDCYVAGGCHFLDSPGHPLDPAARLAHQPADPEQVRPIHIANNVWVGTQAMIMPGVTIGEGSVVAARAVVTSDVPPYTVVGGTPARPIRQLDPPAAGRPDSGARLG